MISDLLVELSSYLSVRDIMNLSETCHMYRELIIHNDKLWFGLLIKKISREQIISYTEEYHINNYQLYSIIKEKLHTFGDNSKGWLGLGHNNNVNVPTEVTSLQNVTMVACCRYHAAVIANHKLYTFGSNKYGQLGLGPSGIPPRLVAGSNQSAGHNNEVNIPIEVKSLQNVMMVACGWYHTAVIADNKLHTFGRNSNGQLGLGHNNDVNVPTEVKSLQNVTMVACGEYHTAVIADNKLYTFGWNHDGQLGLGHNNNVNVPTEVTSLQNVRMIACGGFHTAIIADNKLYTFGCNGDGQLGLGHKNNINVPTEVKSLLNVTMIVCGSFHTIVTTIEINIDKISNKQ